MTFTCPDCGFNGEPDAVRSAAIVDGVLVTCADCGTTTVQPLAFATAHREEHQPEGDA